MLLIRNDHKVAQLMEQAKQCQEITLRGSFARGLFWALICFVLAFVAYMTAQADNLLWRYILPVLFIGGGLIILLSGRSSYLHLSPDGISTQFITSRTFVPWADVVSFHRSLAGPISIEVRQPETTAGSPGLTSTPIPVRKTTLPGEFAMKPRQLLQLLETYRAATHRGD